MTQGLAQVEALLGPANENTEQIISLKIPQILTNWLNIVHLILFSGYVLPPN